MPKQFDHDLSMLKKNLLTMSELVETMIQNTLASLIEWKPELLDPVSDIENKLDIMQREIDEETIRLISVYTPVASDLRFLLMATKIVAELERIGDKAMDIGFYAKTLFKEPLLKPFVDIPRMASLSMEMLKISMEAFDSKSAEKALVVIEMDDKVDDLHDQVFRELITYVLGDSKTITRVLELVLIARAFERIADHTVNISESIVYLVKGEDIRHLDKLNA